MSRAKDWKPKLERIEDLLVEGDLHYTRANGSTGKIHVIIGRPKPAPDKRDYYCPIQAKGCFKGVKPVFGGGPVDSLMNAMSMMRYYYIYLNDLIDELPEHYERPTLRHRRIRPRRWRPVPW